MGVVMVFKWYIILMDSDGIARLTIYGLWMFLVDIITNYSIHMYSIMGFINQQT